MRDTVYRSDLSGKVIEGAPVEVRIIYNGQVRILHFATSEAEAQFGQMPGWKAPQKMPGRKAA